MDCSRVREGRLKEKTGPAGATVALVPSFSHEALVELFRNFPELAPMLLRSALGLELPAYTSVRLESADLTQIAPAEYHADLVLLLEDERPVLGIVLEVQLEAKQRKRFTWPVYVAGLRARLECEACVLVVAPSDDVATWAVAPIVLGPGASLRPLVLGPSSIPSVVELDEARRAPELAVLSALAHSDDARVAFAAMLAALDLPDERALLYSDWIRASLGQAVRAALEELMETRGHEFQSEFARKHDARGRATGRAESILSFLDARGLVVSDDQRQRILGCTDLEQLDKWVRRAATVSSTDELFVE